MTEPCAHEAFDVSVVVEPTKAQIVPTMLAQGQVVTYTLYLQARCTDCERELAFLGLSPTPHTGQQQLASRHDGRVAVLTAMLASLPPVPAPAWGAATMAVPEEPEP